MAVPRRGGLPRRSVAVGRVHDPPVVVGDLAARLARHPRPGVPRGGEHRGPGDARAVVNRWADPAHAGLSAVTGRSLRGGRPAGGGHGERADPPVDAAPALRVVDRALVRRAQRTARRSHDPAGTRRVRYTDPVAGPGPVRPRRQRGTAAALATTAGR